MNSTVPSPSPRIAALLAAVLAAGACAAPRSGGGPAPADPAATGASGATAPAAVTARRAGARVAATPRFVFHSDPVVNLHDFLVWGAASDRPVEPRPDCVGTLSPAQRDGLESAVRLYARDASGRDPGHDRLLLALRFHLVGDPNELVPAADQAPYLAALEEALPAYLSCWWPTHDRRNRDWIAAALPLLEAHGGAVADRLAAVYGTAWEWPVAVDAASHVNYGGANTVVRPHHILITAVDPAYQREGALEMLFHEASHTVVNPRSGPIAETIRAAATELGVDAPRGLWHVLLFHAAGTVTRDRLRDAGTDYVPYMVREGLWERAWLELREPVERHWGAYLRGEVGMLDAVKGVIADVAAPGEDAGGGANAAPDDDAGGGANAPPPGGESPFDVTELAAGVFAAVVRPEAPSYAFANSLFVVGDDGVLVVDTQQSARAARFMRAEVRARTDLPVRWVVNTHWHPDHTWGNQVYEAEGPEILATAATRDSLLAGWRRHVEEQRSGTHRSLARLDSLARGDRTDDERRQIRDARAVRTRYLAALDSVRPVPPTRVIDAPTTLDLGGITVELIPVGPAHTPGDLVVWVPDHGIAAVGDLLEEGGLWLEGADAAGWVRALERVRALEPAVVVPSHGGIQRDDTLLETQLEELRETAGAPGSG